MSAVVLDLRPVENQPDADMVAYLEEILGRVRRGEIAALAVVCHHRGGEIGTIFRIAEGGDGAHLVAALEKVKMRLLFPGVS